MEDWASGYISDIDYTFGFYRELTPEILNLVALVKGNHAAGTTLELSYCELGCGQGFTTNILAAANPQMRFYATDFNPAQIGRAKLLAAEAGLGNVNFYDESFADFATAPDLPESFDFIVLHGIYSWISAENRAAIVDFIRRKLRVGGIVYISYNALPGWAGAMPMRRLFVDHAATGNGPIVPRIDASLAFAERLIATNARFFLGNQPVVERFNHLKNANRHYLAHEYFNRDWIPFYAADIFADMAQAKLTFLGSAALLEQIDSVNLTAEQQLLLSEISDPARRETLKDYCINTQFRRDVFQKGGVAVTPGMARAVWLDQRFALSVPRANFNLTIKGALGEAELKQEIYAPILDAYASGPKTLREVIGEQSIDADAWARLLQATVVLVGIGRLEPCLPAKDESKRLRSTRAFNHAVLARSRESADLQYLASPVTGGGISVPRFHQLFLLALQQGLKSPVDWADYAWKILLSQGQGLIKDGVALPTAEENIAELTRQAEGFAAGQLGVLKALQIA